MTDDDGIMEDCTESSSQGLFRLMDVCDREYLGAVLVLGLFTPGRSTDLKDSQILKPFFRTHNSVPHNLSLSPLTPNLRLVASI